jgi:hypothetical protein
MPILLILQADCPADFAMPKARLAPTFRSRRRPALGDARLIKPDRQIAPIDQRPVVLLPGQTGGVANAAAFPSFQFMPLQKIGN